MEVSNRRPALPEAKLVEKQRRAAYLQGLLKRIDEIGDGLNQPIWLHIVERMEKKIRQVDDLHMNYAESNLTDRAFFASMGEKVCAQQVLAIKDFVNGREKFQEELDTLKQEIKALVRAVPANHN